MIYEAVLGGDEEEVLVGSVAGGGRWQILVFGLLSTVCFQMRSVAGGGRRAIILYIFFFKSLGCDKIGSQFLSLPNSFSYNFLGQQWQL